MNFPEMIAAYEAELVHRACQAGGFDAALTEEVGAWHSRHPALLDYAERSSDGVGYYVRGVAELLSRPAVGLAQVGSIQGVSPSGPNDHFNCRD